MHSLRAAAFDLSNQNLVQERMEHHIAEMNCREESMSVMSRHVRNGCFNQGGPHPPAHGLP